MIRAKRWVMRGKQEVVIDEFEFDPAKLEPRQIAVRAEFTAVSPGTECANYLALDPDVYSPTGWCRYPWTPGYAGVGTVIGLGKDVSEFKIGDQVVGPMSHATHCRLDVDGPVARRNPRVAPEHAAFARIIAIAVTAQQVLPIQPFAVAGVWGMGMIGNLVGQVLRCGGARVVGIDPLPQRRELATRCGYRDTLDPTASSFAERVNELTSGQGFDVAVEVTGIAAVAVTLPNFTRRLGHMVIMTHWRSQPVVDTAPMVHGIFWKGLTVHGAHEWVGSHLWSRDRGHVRERLDQIQRQIESGGIVVGPLISHTVKPDACKQVYKGLSFDKNHWRGVVVDWR